MTYPLLLPAIVLLGACASPTPPSVTATDIANAEAAFERFDALDPPEAMPRGQAVYTGQLGGDLRVNGNGGYAILADLEIRSDFDAGTVDGEVTNVNLIIRGTPDQTMGGQLMITGTTDGDGLTARAEGRLSAVPDDIPVRGSAAMSMEMDGRFAQDGGETVLTGAWEGRISEGDFTAVGQGQFYAQ